MRQQTLASQASFERYGKTTRREKFLEEMDSIMPWTELEALIAPHYPKAGSGRPPLGLSIMLRIYFLQHWFNLSDPAAEEALYDSPALRRFAGVDLGRAPAPDETTILNFRNLLERHDLCGAMLEAVNGYLESRGMRIGTGTIVDATIIHAPSSTKNATGGRDPAMHQTRKGKQWCFRDEGAHRGGREARPCTLAVLDGGQRGRHAHAAGFTSWRRAQSMGRRRLSRAARGDPHRRAAGPGHDFAADKIQASYRRVTTKKEPRQKRGAA